MTAKDKRGKGYHHQTCSLVAGIDSKTKYDQGKKDQQHNTWSFGQRQMIVPLIDLQLKCVR